MDIIAPWFSSRKHSIKQLRRTEAITTEFEEFIEKPQRRICKLAVSSSSPDSEDGEIQELYSSLLTFGPFYNRDDSLMSTLKEAAWQHVLFRSPTTEAETTKIYMSAMQRIGIQAKNTYPDGMVPNRSPRFLSSMMKDGCFILQLVLFILGGSEQLNYAPDHLIFGEQRNTKQIRKWAKSLFFVGNQVPQVVLKELMKQSFFQQVLSARRWERPSDLFSRALYDLLLLPQILETEHLRQGRLACLFQGIPQNLGIVGTKELQQPSDLLHGLQLLVIGAGSGVAMEDEFEEGDLEGDGEDFGVSISIRSATELRQAGIHFRNARGMGIRGIKFTTTMFQFCAVLALPTLEADDDAQMLFRCLGSYEISQPLGRNKREVRSYLQFMSELIRTPDDAKLLSTHGIIQANRNQREKLPAILNSLAGGDSTQSLRIVRHQIEDYSRPPWEKIRNFLSVVVLLTVVQTIYTVLGYYKN